MAKKPSQWQITKEWNEAKAAEAAKGAVVGWYKGGIVMREDALTRAAAVEWREERDKREGDPNK